MKNSKVTKANSTKQGMNLKKKAILLSMDLQSTQAGIGRPLSKGTKLIHLERIIRFLINKLEQPSSLDERDEEMDSLMCQFLNSINAPKDPSNDLTGRESSSEKHIFVKPKCS